MPKAPQLGQCPVKLREMILSLLTFMIHHNLTIMWPHYKVLGLVSRHEMIVGKIPAHHNT